MDNIYILDISLEEGDSFEITLKRIIISFKEYLALIDIVVLNEVQLEYLDILNQAKRNMIDPNQ
jgi:hypothetical protein